MDELLENLRQTTSFNKFSSNGFLDFSYTDWAILRVQMMLISYAFGMNFPLPDTSPILLQSADNALDANVEIADGYFKELVSQSMDGHLLCILIYQRRHMMVHIAFLI